MIDTKTITMHELRSMAEAGDKEAIKLLNEFREWFHKLGEETREEMNKDSAWRAVAGYLDSKKESTNPLDRLLEEVLPFHTAKVLQQRYADKLIEDAKKSDSVVLDITEKRKPRSKYSEREIKDAIRAWNRIVERGDSIRLHEFLWDRFGQTYGKPNVADSTFYGWRTALEKKGKLKRTHK